MTYKKAYLDLVAQTRREGWKVRHGRVAQKDLAWMNAGKRMIMISAHLPWKERLRTLAHEIGHVQQGEEEKWVRFIYSGKLTDTPANREYVVRAEIDASKKGRKLLRKMGFIGIEFPELDPDLVLCDGGLAEAWIRDYIRIRKPRKRKKKRRP